MKVEECSFLKSGQTVVGFNVSREIYKHLTDKRLAAGSYKREIEPDQAYAYLFIMSNAPMMELCSGAFLEEIIRGSGKGSIFNLI